MKKVIGIVVVLVLIAGAVFGYRAFRNKGKNGSDKYKVERVDRGNITMTVTATGTLSAVTTVQVGSQVSGVIARLYADFNSHVTKGQLLAELDPTPFQAQVEQRQADVTKAKVDAANIRITFDREKRLVDAGLASQADLDSAKAQLGVANAQVQQAAAALQQAQTNLHYTKILSPIAGVVVDRQYDVGQTVAASFQAPTLFSIAQDLTKMQVQADVDQSDIGSVHVGHLARFTVDAYPEKEFRGRISQIRYNATVTQNVVTYPVIIEVPNPDQELRPKMTANVTIDVATVPNVLRVANGALRFKPDTSGEGRRGMRTSTAGGNQQASNPEATASRMGERRPGVTGAAVPWGAGKAQKGQTVWILGPDQKPKAAMIRTGITDGHFTQIVSGNLKEGDPVIVGLATSKVEGPPPPGSRGR